MEIQKTEWNFEEKRLKEILVLIDGKLKEGNRFLTDFKQQVRETNKQMWDDVTLAWDSWEDLDILVRAHQYLIQHKQLVVTYDYYRSMTQRLRRMAVSPYFGRIDFHEDGVQQPEQIYIGIYTLIDDVTKDCLIYDWRASISSMFYDSEPGRSVYHCSDGSIAGELLRKRQYKIADGEIQFMFDTHIKIDDEILQNILSQNSTGRMKNIVTTIQREQNQVIRDDEHRLLIVQGAAGSGKTSIALHRVAYLLYKYRNTINSDNILIFSPNLVFSDYISNVLPELGEENMRQMTFHEYALKTLGQPRYKALTMQIEDVTDQLEYFYRIPEDQAEFEIRVAGSRYKASAAFVQVIKNYLLYLEKEGLVFTDLTYEGESVTTQEELQELWQRYGYLPIEKRLKKIRQKVLLVINAMKKKRINDFRQSLGKRKDSSWDIALKEYMYNLRLNLLPLKQTLREMLSYDECELYLTLFRDEALFRKMVAAGGSSRREERTERGEHLADITQSANWNAICLQTIQAFTHGVVRYEDVAPLLYLKRALQGAYPFATNIKHVFIDEAQDYSLFHYEIVRQLFPQSHLTVLGDLNQSIHPYMGIGDYDQIAEIFTEDARLVHLMKSYRSTKEISAFAQAILGSANKFSGTQNAIDRPGEKPKLIRVKRDEVQNALLADIISLQQKSAQSIAVICKTASESEQVYKLLQGEIKISFISAEDQEFQRETIVIPSYLAKGLEFDAVLIYVEEDGYREDEVYLLYTMCTRALHYLHIYCVGHQDHLNQTLLHSSPRTEPRFLD